MTVSYAGQILKFCLRQQLFPFKKVCMETRFSNILKTTNVMNLAKVIKENPKIENNKTIPLHLAAPFGKKYCRHLEFLMNQIFGQRFIIFEKVRYRGQLLLKLRPSKLLLHFVEYRQDKLNGKRTKTAVN